MTKKPIFYAIGDIHGEAERLRRLHGYIRDRHAFEYADHPMTIIHLGDYIDRGPDSCGVISTILSIKPEPNQTIINLRGNHEQMMLDAMDRRSDTSFANWCRFGGDETMASYRKHGHAKIPDAHIKWVRSLPTIHVEQDAGLVFVHAGIDIDVFPDCPENVHMWTRSQSFLSTDLWLNPALDGKCVIHGHTPTETFYPEMDGDRPKRINIDTGAVFGGRLTAAVIAPDQDVKFIYA